ncbi:MAG TPA: arylsulfatase, partial [Gammaproteobacteria bacterium]|nr:arylsulfatase [Gammaproteobacteria bacterium]
MSRKAMIGHLATLVAFVTLAGVSAAQAQQPAAARKPNILVIWGDDIGEFNISAYNLGRMGYKTPNI